MALTLIATASVALAACGGAGTGTAATPGNNAPAPATAPAATSRAYCSAATADLGMVARRVYAQAVRGRNAVSVASKLRASPALAAALARGDARATRAALAPILSPRTVRLDLWHGRRRLVSVGHHRALGPSRGTLRDARGRVVGRFVLAVIDDPAYASLVRRLTGGELSLSTGGHQITGTPGLRATGGARVYSFDGAAFPRARLKIVLRVPPFATAACGASAAEARVNAAALVGQRLYQAEGSSHAVDQTLSYALRNPAFRRAISAGDAAATTAVIRNVFFHEHRLHIVRVRVEQAGKVLVDVGGPYVLAPASRAMTGAGGAQIATVTLAVQDDTGYIKLMHRFTGAAVVLRTPAGQVPGSNLSPGPVQIPARGPVTYHGKRYEAYSFTARAFPSGPLYISLLVHAR